MGSFQHNKIYQELETADQWFRKQAKKFKTEFEALGIDFQSVFIRAGIMDIKAMGVGREGKDVRQPPCRSQNSSGLFIRLRTRIRRSIRCSRRLGTFHLQKATCQESADRRIPFDSIEAQFANIFARGGRGTSRAGQEA